MKKGKTQRRYSDLERQELIEQWKQSGQSKPVFCKERGIGYTSLLDWLRGGKRRASNKVKSSFIPVEVTQRDGHIFVQLILKNGATVNIHQQVDASYLLTLLKS